MDLPIPTHAFPTRRSSDLTQIIFGSHSPMCISMGKADEIRLTRRTPCEDSEFKQCALQALDLSNVAQKLRTGWDKPPEQYTAQTLIPRDRKSTRLNSSH